MTKLLHCFPVPAKLRKTCSVIEVCEMYASILQVRTALIYFWAEYRIVSLSKSKNKYHANWNLSHVQSNRDANPSYKSGGITVMDNWKQPRVVTKSINEELLQMSLLWTDLLDKPLVCRGALESDRSCQWATRSRNLPKNSNHNV